MVKEITNKPTLREYQKEDVQKLLRHKAMGCFNEQRTGKTPTAIVTMEERNINKLIIVTTASSIYQWKDEYELWSGKPATVLTGTKQNKLKTLAKYTTGALIVSYDSFKATKTQSGLVDKILAKNPEGIIFDEAHNIKNHKTANARAAFKCLKIPYRLALTGTPAPNKQHEVWSILHLIYPERFTSFWNFIGDFCEVSIKYNKQGKPYKEIGNILPNKLKTFQKILDDRTTQRKRKEVMQWLPDKDYINIRLEPTEEQSRYLSELKKYFETDDVVVQGVLDRLIRYRQICLHPNLIDLKGSSPKLDWVLQYLKDYPEVPTLLFTKFTSFIHILTKVLTKKEIKYASITGNTSPENRKKYVDDFQKGKYNFLILNIDAGKEALTLDRAEAAIFTDKFPPVADIAQAEDRFIATTETKANKGHTIYNLMIKGTYDEQVHRLLKTNASNVDVINDYKKYMKGK